MEGREGGSEASSQGRKGRRLGYFFTRGISVRDLLLYGVGREERLGHRWWRKNQQGTHGAQELGMALPSGESHRTLSVGLCARKGGRTHRGHNVNVKSKKSNLY